MFHLIEGTLDFWFAVLLGVVQGATEFLPISSSAHLRFVPELFGQSDPGASFTAVIQLGTVLAVLIYFYQDLIRIFKAGILAIGGKRSWSDKDSRLFLGITIGTIPIVVMGLLLQDVIRNAFRNLYLVAILLVIVGLIIWLIDKYATQSKTASELTYRQMFLIGVAQSFALIPGVSRSGATIAAARIFKLERKDAARFSFLLSVPAVVASGLYESINISTDNSAGWGATIIATLVSFVVGYAAIAWLLKWLSSHSLGVFAIYRTIIGVGLLILLTAGILNPF